MDESLKAGVTGESSVRVGKDNTAAAMGSGDMEVFATPAMIALAENAAMKAVEPFITEGETTVGSLVAMSHVKPTALGDTVTARARLTEIEGRRLTFVVEAWDSADTIGEGRHVRYVVGRERFLEKLR